MNKAKMLNNRPAVTVSTSLVDFDRQPHLLRYVWQPTDAGRSASKRPRQTRDCTVRALATARGLSYDEAFDILKEAGRKGRTGFRMSEWLNQQPWAEKISFPAKKGQRRMNPSTFTAQFPSGHYIVKVARHVIAISDGVLHDDTEVPPDRCIYTAWKITR